MEYTPAEAVVDLPNLFSDLVRCETRLYNALNESLREQHGIVTSQFESLRFLRDHPGARVIDLANEFAAGVGAMSKGVDRLEKQGWVARQANPADRRSSLLALTEDGTRVVEAVERTFIQQLAELLGDRVAESSLPVVAQAFSKLRGTLERDRIGQPAG